jgi:ATP citrate (pro-S)-lyase
MAHQRISEYRTKHLLAAGLGQLYEGVELNSDRPWQTVIAALPSSQLYVVKVDQAVKGRLDSGLVTLKVPAAKTALIAEQYFGRGYQYLLIEPYISHQPDDEQYLSLRRERTGVTLLYRRHGGNGVEQAGEAVHRLSLSGEQPAAAARTLGLNVGTVTNLHRLFNQHHLTLLEINPLVVQDGRLIALDAAAEVDTAATGATLGSWNEADFRAPAGAVLPEETAVAALDAGTPASFSLKSLNPDGNIFVLLSGGGASLVLADELHHQGCGPLLGNYGEYSGDPGPSEVQAYTKEVLSLLLRSQARPKVLLIAGGVANFTDVRATFSGIVAALDDVKSQLRKEGVRVFVRRGGPFAQQGLAALEQFLASEMLLGHVAGPEQPLTAAVSQVAAAAKQDKQVQV